MKEKQVQNYQLMTIQDTANYMRLSVKTLYTMVSQRRIEVIKAGRLLRFDRNAINEWLKKQTVMPMSSKRD